MRFGRRREPAGDGDPDVTVAPGEDAGTEGGPTTGPFDIADVDVEHDGVNRIDVGSLLLHPGDGRQVQLQLDERTRAVQAVMIANAEGAIELQAFAAPVGESPWPEMREELAAELTQRGGTVAEREGRWGTELVCQVPVRLPDGRSGVRATRVVGVDGPRWLLRATYHGQPATSPEDAGEWEDVFATVVVRRGAQAMPVGDPLPITLPAQPHPPG